MSKAWRKKSAQDIDFESIGAHNPDEDQSKVLHNLGKNLVINAGAGSGKTGTLALAIVEALLNFETIDGSVGPSNILAITYTNAAADELRDRVADLLARLGEDSLAYAMSDSWISTIHSFCNKVLDKYGIDASYLLGRDMPFNLAQDRELERFQNLALDEVVYQLRVNENDTYLQLIGNKEENLRKNLKRALSKEMLFPEEKLEKPPIETPEELKERFDGVTYDYEYRCLKLLERFERLIDEYRNAYERIKREHNVVEYSDIIQEVRNLLEERRDIEEDLKKQFAIIFVDEFQDTNHLQYDIIKRISTDNLIVVGDKQQSIFAFQGADVSVFDSALALTKGEEPQALAIELRNNYRSNPDILNAVNEIFSQPQLFGSDFMHLGAKAQPSDRLPAEHKRVHFHNFRVGKHNTTPKQATAVWIAEEFANLKMQGLFDYSEMAVLVENRSQAKELTAAFSERGIISHVLGGSDLYADPFVYSLITAGFCLTNPLDNNSFISTAISEFGQVEDEALVALGRAITKSKSCSDQDRIFSLYQAALNVIEAGELSDQAHQSLKLFIERINRGRRLIGRVSPSEIYRFLIGDSGVDLLLQNYQQVVQLTFSPEQSLSDIYSLVKEVENQESLGLDFSAIARNLLSAASNGKADKPALFVTHAADEAAKQEDAVTINTMHGSKGLEYPVVAVAIQNSNKGRDGTIQSHFIPKLDQPHIRQRLFSAKFLLTDQEMSGVLKRKEEKISKKSQRVDNKEYKYQVEQREQEKRSTFEEKKRLMYVALTRAEEMLFVSVPHYVAQKANSPKSDDALNPIESVIRAIENCEEKGSISDYAEVVWVPLPEGDDVEVGQRLAPNSLSLKPKDGVETVTRSFSSREKRRVQSSERWIKQISSSEINQFYSCPRQYWYRSVLRLGELSDLRESPQANRGSALHKMLERLAEQSLSTDSLTFVKEAEALISRYALDENDTFDLIERVKRVANPSNPWWSKLMRMPHLSSEHQFYQPFTDKNDNQCFFHGYIDVYARDESNAYILDYKTGYNRERDKNDFEVQANIYALYALLKGADQVEVVFLFVDSKEDDASEQLETLVFTYAQSDQEALLSRLREHKAMLESTKLISEEEVAKGSFKPSCFSCSFRGTLCRGV